LTATIYGIQLTDTHLFEDPAARLWDVAPDPMLDCVLREVERVVDRARFLLVTGDCSSDGSPASYERLARKLSRFDLPIYYLPGNHDNAGLMARVLGGMDLPLRRKWTQTFVVGDWRFVLLDTSIPGEDGGELGDEQRAWLRRTLAQYPQSPTIVVMHHNPVPVGSEWLDTMTLADRNALSAILETSPQVRAVLFGHVHQVFECRANGTRYLSAPSTFFQFKPCSRRFGRDDRSPGFRMIQLNGQTLRSAVYRTGEVPPPLM
jgi:Icc protein